MRAAVAADEQRRIRELDILFYRNRADSDPISADDRSRLAHLYLARGRATGDPQDPIRAESEARKALAIRSAHNSAALLVLASALMEQHRFVEAMDPVRVLVEREPDDESHRAFLGEIYLELGRYDDARSTFASITRSRRSLTVAPRLARLAEIEGRNDAARLMLVAARDEAMRRPDMPPEQLAWFHVKVADHEIRAGRFRGAKASLAAALAAHPGDYRALATLVTLATAQRDWSQVLLYGEEAIAAMPDPGTLGAMADAHHALGDSAQAEDFAHAAELAALGTSEPLHRAWSLFLLDHNRGVAEVHARAMTDLETRRDVFGYEVVAWSHHVQGRHVDARAAMRNALAQGTRDAGMMYRAGMIERALGDSATARRFLEEALAINPQFGPARVAMARRPVDWLVALADRAEIH